MVFKKWLNKKKILGWTSNTLVPKTALTALLLPSTLPQLWPTPISWSWVSAVWSSEESSNFPSRHYPTVWSLRSWGVGFPSCLQVTPSPHPLQVQAPPWQGPSLALMQAPMRMGGNVCYHSQRLMLVGGSPRVASCCLTSTSHNPYPYSWFLPISQTQSSSFW